jgi:hypothetical protein
LARDYMLFQAGRPWQTSPSASDFPASNPGRCHPPRPLTPRHWAILDVLSHLVKTPCPRTYCIARNLTRRWAPPASLLVR